MSEPTTFTIGDTTFIVNRLRVKRSLFGLRLVGKVLLPALAEAHGAPAGQIGAAVAKVVEGLDCLPELLDLFTPETKFTSPTRENATALQPFVEDVFSGSPDMAVQYLVECVQAEYGGFLGPNGLLGKLLGKAGVDKPSS